MRRDELCVCLDELLEPHRFRDYCPNGLQVEGRNEVQRVVCGVTACQSLLEAAIAENADAIIVHHGWFWKNEDGRICGYRKRRLQTLLAHDINLIAYHLPLDAHAELGNNSQLARLLDWRIDGRFGEQDIAFHGAAAAPLSAAALAATLEEKLGRQPQLIGAGDALVKRLAWCSGGAQGFFEEAVRLGVDAFVSGEISEQTVHLARESGVAYLAAGHHATERGGVMALAGYLEQRCGLECRFVDIDNPV